MKKQKQMRFFIFLAIVVYLVLILVLYASESHAVGSTINDLGDAFWYSLVTLTTVGYGDIMPVTPVGHAIGAIFLVLAAGILVAMMSAAVSFVTSEGFPMARLKANKWKDWYYFADCGVEARALAKNIVKENSNAFIIFGEKMDECSELPDHDYIVLQTSPSRIAACKKGKGSKMRVFLMKENDIGFNTRAENLHELPVDVYANSTNGEDVLSGNIHFFHAYDCCAREYWRNHPIQFSESSIVLIGFGNYGRQILERAILTNVISEKQHVAYHIFGDGEVFLQIHPYLSRVFSINEVSDDRDSLIFHEESWCGHHELISCADRIIIAEDSVEKCWDVFWRMRSYYQYSCRIDLRSARVAPGVSWFGADEEIYTPEHIMRTSLNRAAVAMNDLFRASVEYPTLSWEELDDFHRQSKIAAADHLPNKIRILLKNEALTDISDSVMHQAHEIYDELKMDSEKLEAIRKIEYMRWIRFYTFYNWSYGEKRDDKRRCHPMLCGYENLTEEQKIERDTAWDLLCSISHDQ